MSYIGNSSITQNFASGTDYFNGDGSTTAFTLSRPVVSVNDVQAYINGVAQTPNTAYTISTNTITFTSAPGTGTNNIYVRYASTTTLTQQPPYAPVILGDATINGVTVGRGASYIASNTAVGNNALAATNISGSAVNSAFGQYSLYSNTSGSGNTALGNSSLFSNTTGYYNSAIGYAALYTNTTGIQNNAMGYLCLAYNTTGNYNTAVGHQALQANTTASNNTAVGFQAAYSNTTGASNTSIGRQAGYALVSGGQNTSIGANALDSGDASYNVAVGYTALSTSSGQSNTAIGNGALKANSTANNNTGVGYQAGFNNTGSQNTFLGRLAGYTKTTGTYNTFVGDESGYNQTTGDGNTYVGTGPLSCAGSSMTTGSKNAIFGAFSGFQGGLDIRTASNYIVLSDGDGNPRGIFDNAGYFYLGSPTSVNASILNVTQSSNTGCLGVTNTNASFAATVIFGSTTRAANSVYDLIGMYAGTSVAQFRVNGAGTIYAQNTTVQSISDQRLKENIKNSTDGLDVITALRPVRYDWKEGYGNDQKNQLGFIAQEVEKVFPEAVSEWQVNKEDETIYKTVGPSAFIPILVKAIQELKAEVDSLKQQLGK